VIGIGLALIGFFFPTAMHLFGRLIMSAFQIRGLDHVVLRCTDVQAMLKFYCGVLGCTVAKNNERLGLLHLRAGTTMIDLVDVKGTVDRPGGLPPSAERPNMDHFCLRIEPFDLERLTAHLRSHGLDPGEPRTRFGAEGDGPSVYLQDPEGNRVELKGPSKFA
jgi:catechol 2,3-dioxygenase-like lactoylglutathione lyase family enzyme